MRSDLGAAGEIIGMGLGCALTWELRVRLYEVTVAGDAGGAMEEGMLAQRPASTAHTQCAARHRGAAGMRWHGDAMARGRDGTETRWHGDARCSRASAESHGVCVPSAMALKTCAWTDAPK